MQRSRGNGFFFWPILMAIVASDVVSKWIAVRALDDLRGVPHDAIGEFVRFTLVYNAGAAFGLSVGDPGTSRWVFTLLTIGALLILGRLYLSSPRGDRLRVFSLALVCGGAVGNLIDRIRHPLGVVDFLDVGVGDARWPTFNVADMAVSIGAFLLAIVLWHDDRAQADATVGLVRTELRHESGEAS